ncbi:MAG: dephospho-CoA kinase [Candidatus Hydrogenedentes bacterium]|nr:dephospho-CoA kinase [Candidatus Hydrogenedentota bacterium]
MKIYGLTGGTGSGKSEAGRRFSQAGIPVLDADAIGHELLESTGPVRDSVLRVFGDGILTDGQIDREKLGAIVFGDADRRATLNQIVHPAIRMEIGRRCARLAEEGKHLALIDAALLGENERLDPFLSDLVLVLAPEEMRIDRLVRLRGLSDAEARRRIDAQTPPERKIALARWVIENTGTLEKLHEEVDRIAGELIRNGE